MSALRLVVFGLFLCFCREANACDCARKLNDDTAELVFEGVAGKPLRWKEVGADASTELIRVRFDNAVISKGPQRKSILIETSRSDCGFPFQEGRHYRVYAQSFSGPETEWLVGACSLTREISAK
jgi:hypothetical protein